MFELAILALIGFGIYSFTKKDDDAEHPDGVEPTDKDKYLETTPSYVESMDGYQILRDDRAKTLGQKIKAKGYRVENVDMSPSGNAVVLTAVTPGDSTMPELDERAVQLADTVSDDGKAVMIMLISDVVSILEKGVMPESMMMYVASSSKRRELAPDGSRFVQTFLVQK